MIVSVKKVKLTFVIQEKMLREFEIERQSLKTRLEEDVNKLKGELENEKKLGSELKSRVESEKEDLVEMFNVDKRNATMLQEKQKSQLSEQLQSAKQRLDSLASECNRLKLQLTEVEEEKREAIVERDTEIGTLKQTVEENQLVSFL